MKNRFSGFFGKRAHFAARVFMIFIAFAIGFTTLLMLLFVFRQTERMKADLMARGQMMAALLADTVRTAVFVENRLLIEDAVKGILSRNEVLSVSVFTVDGRLLLNKVNPIRDLPNNEKAVRTSANFESVRTFQAAGVDLRSGILALVEPVRIEHASGSEDALFFGSSPGRAEPEVIGYVEVVFVTSQLTEDIRQVILENVAIALFLLVAGAVILSFALRKVLRPLMLLTEEVRQFGEGSPVRTISIGSDDEIGRLAAAFNTMTENLTKREEEARSFENRLRLAQKMEAVGTLARGIAHDFSNLLTTVQASIYFMQKRIDSAHPFHASVYHMNKAVEKAKTLIQSLLMFSKGQAASPAPLELNMLIAQTMPLIGELAGSAIECRTALSEQPLVVLADAVQLEQVLMNFATNARDAMPDGGVLTITTGQVLVPDDAPAGPQLPPPGRYASISVMDTGQGIGKELQERVFEPFFTTKEVGKGTGLGLSIVYGIIEQHGGFIFIVSEPGQGAEFRIYLPLCQATESIGQDSGAEG